MSEKKTNLNFNYKNSNRPFNDNPYSNQKNTGNNTILNSFFNSKNTNSQYQDYNLDQSNNVLNNTYKNIPTTKSSIFNKLNSSLNKTNHIMQEQGKESNKQESAEPNLLSRLNKSLPKQVKNISENKVINNNFNPGNYNNSSRIANSSQNNYNNNNYINTNKENIYSKSTMNSASKTKPVSLYKDSNKNNNANMNDKEVNNIKVASYNQMNNMNLNSSGNNISENKSNRNTKLNNLKNNNTFNSKSLVIQFESILSNQQDRLFSLFSNKSGNYLSSNILDLNKSSCEENLAFFANAVDIIENSLENKYSEIIYRKDKELEELQKSLDLISKDNSK